MPIGFRTACGFAADPSSSTAFLLKSGSMASVAALLTIFASEAPKAMVSFHEGMTTVVVSFASLDGVPDGGSVACFGGGG